MYPGIGGVEGFVFDGTEAASNATGSGKVTLYTSGVFDTRDESELLIEGYGIEKGSSTSLERLYTKISCMYQTAI